MLEQVGGFDDTFFAFFEDVDVAWRARAHGWRTLYAPEAVVYHHHSATARHGSPAKLYLVGRNRRSDPGQERQRGDAAAQCPAHGALRAGLRRVHLAHHAEPRAAHGAACTACANGEATGAAAPPIDERWTSTDRSASGARCADTGPGIRTTAPARCVDRHPDARGGRARLVPGLSWLRAHGRGDAGPLRARPRCVHLPRRPRAPARPPGPRHRARVAPGRAARHSPAGPRPGPLALAPALHAAVLLAARPERLRPRRQLVPRLRGRREAPERRAARLLLLHAHALCLDAGRGARPRRGA